MRFLLKLVLAGATAMGLIVIGGAPAFAAVDNMMPTCSADGTKCTWNDPCVAQTMATARVVCQTDNANLTYFEEVSVSNNMSSRIYDALYNSYNGSDLNVSYDSTPDTSGAAETDIIYQQDKLPASGMAGLTWCNDDVDSAFYDCDQAYVRFNPSPFYEHRHLTCHETGHAVGLTHGSDAYPVTADDNASILGCLRTPYNVNDYVLGSNNFNLINATY